MIKIALSNTKLLKYLLKIPILKHFFTLKISADFQQISEIKILNKFYTSIYVNNKTSKKTSKNRFSEIEELTLKYLKKNNMNNIHDLAVSNGITSVDLYKFLNDKAVNFNLTVSDKFSKFHVKKGFITRYFDNDHNFTFAYVGVFYASDKNIFFPLTMLLYHLVKLMPNDKQYNQTQLLFFPELLHLISSKYVNYIDYDIFDTKTSKKYNFVRCMNILNLGYFGKNEIEKAICNIAGSIEPNGILLIGRTHTNNVNNASFFIKKEDKFVLLEDVNSGSEIKDMVVNFNTSLNQKSNLKMKSLII